jgi:hypothetical protein
VRCILVERHQTITYGIAEQAEMDSKKKNATFVGGALGVWVFLMTAVTLAEELRPARGVPVSLLLGFVTFLLAYVVLYKRALARPELSAAEVEAQRKAYDERILRGEISRRKSIAIDKKIFDTAAFVVSRLGSLNRYKDDLISIVLEDVADHKVRAEISFKERPEDKYSIAFESLYTKKRTETTVYDQLSLTPNGDGGLDIQTKSRSTYTTPSALEILSYQPGNWELHLNELLRRAHEMVNKRVQQLKEDFDKSYLEQERQSFEEERKRFGL